MIPYQQAGRQFVINPFMRVFGAATNAPPLLTNIDSSESSVKNLGVCSENPAE